MEIGFLHPVVTKWEQQTLEFLLEELKLVYSLELLAQLHFLHVKKNWHPLLLGPELAIDR